MSSKVSPSKYDDEGRHDLGEGDDAALKANIWHPVDASPSSVETRQTPRGTHAFGGLIFKNIEGIKERVRAEQISQRTVYNVHDMYHRRGVVQFIAKHPYFENFTLGVIVVNAIWIGLDTDLNNSDTINEAHPVFQVGESLFFTYFFLELLIRFLAFKRKASCFRDGWFTFDFILVVLYAFDPFVLGIMALAGGGGVDLPTSLLRLARLARLSRLVRMLRSLPELMIFVKGMVQSTETVGYVVMLLLVITYVFAIALHNLVDKDKLIALDPGSGEDGPPKPPGFFSGVAESSLSLMVYATFLDGLSDFIYTIMDDDIVCWALCWLYIFVATLTVLNMLIGVLCTVIETVAAEENEAMRRDDLYERFQLILKNESFDGGRLTWFDFQRLMDCQEVIEALENVDTDPEILIEIAEDFFFDDGVPCEINLDQLMSIILDLRGDQSACKQHVSTWAKQAQTKFNRVHSRIDSFDRKLDAIIKALDVPSPPGSCPVSRDVTLSLPAMPRGWRSGLASNLPSSIRPPPPNGEPCSLVRGNSHTQLLE